MGGQHPRMDSHGAAGHIEESREPRGVEEIRCHLSEATQRMTNLREQKKKKKKKLVFRLFNLNPPVR